MLRFTKTAILGVLALAAVATSAPAQMHDPAEVFLSGQIAVGGSHLLAPEHRLAGASGRDAIDYAVFVHELVAFIAKEVLPDAGDEYVDSEIPSRLSPSMPQTRSRFGEHCLIVLAEIGSHVSPFPEGSFSSFRQSPSILAYLARAGSTVLMVERLWSSFRNEVEDRPSGFSLDPKVGTNKVGAYLTFRW